MSIELKNSVSWTPVIKGSVNAGTFTYYIVRGQYVSIGRLKYYFIHLVVNSISGNPSGNLQITGSPFLPLYDTPLTLGITSYFTADMSQRYIVPIIFSNGVIELLSCGTNTESAVTINKITNSSTIQISGSFISNV
ncbi:MAG: hypothetical protein LBS84_10875 [Clostridiales bacterium]|jgi:hypothetical protein|nr:hypothetical protein [Clostridiales bacterium]